MTRRRTRCLTYWQPKHKTAVTGTINGEPFHMCMTEWVTLCGRDDDDPMETPNETLLSRPVGICRSCWAVWKRDVREMRDAIDDGEILLVECGGVNGDGCSMDEP